MSTETTTLEKELNITKQVTFYYPPFIIDTLARWLMLGIYRYLAEQQSEIADFYVFVIANVIITIMTLFIIMANARKLKNKYEFVRERDYDTKVTIFAVLFIVFVIFSFNYIFINVLREQAWYIKEFENIDGRRTVIPTIVFFIYTVVVIPLAASSITVPKPKKTIEDKIKEDKNSPIQSAFSGQEFADEVIRSISPEAQSYQTEDIYEYEIDHNDNELVKLEGHLKNESTRIDAYILESVLFGALAFSAFLTIISSERFNLTKSDFNGYYRENPAYVVDLYTAAKQRNTGRTEITKDTIQKASQQKTKTLPTFDPEKQVLNDNHREIEIFWDNFSSLFSNVLLFKFSEAGRALEELTKPRNLLMVIMIETLFCSLFFVSVIAARLRYSNIAEEIDNLIRLARTLNDKEEEVHNLSLYLSDDDLHAKSKLKHRLDALSRSIDSRIKKAKEFALQTKPIVYYMSFLRNLGVFTFILILLTSSFFFSRTLAILFFTLAIMAYLYESIDSRLRINRVKKAQQM